MPSPCPHLVSRPLAGGRVDLLLTTPEMQAGGPSLLRVHPHPDSASHTLSSRLPLKLRAASSRDPRPTPGPSSPRCIFLLPPVRAAPPPLCPLGSHFTGGQGLLGQGGVDLHSPGTQLGLRDCPKLCVCVFAHECVHACTGVYACVRSRVGAGPGTCSQPRWAADVCCWGDPRAGNFFLPQRGPASRVLAVGTQAHLGPWPGSGPLYGRERLFR